ncbi:MAG: hypothetical protein HYZ14_02255 [Bacteroidetes bacterium]|nr:hypothetical protein [Bacteroidota bacterium]
MKFFNSNTVLGFIILLVAFFVFNPPLHEILSWDILAHYIYLPLAFDQHNLVMHNAAYLEQVNETYHVTPVLYQFVETPDGRLFSKCTAGWALLQLPFYLVAEVWAHLAGVKTDGFTYPYQVMMYFGSWFYAMLGLIFTRKILRHFFSDIYTALLLLLLVFGTNLFFMYYSSVGQSNHFALFAAALLVWRIICFYKNQTTLNAIYVGAAWALLVLIRPPDGIIGLLFFFWNVTSWQSFKEQLTWFFKTHRRITVVVGVTFFVLFLPQMIYWYFSAGSLLLNSYSNNNGEGLDFFDPYLVEFLFSFRKGWLLYTPLMIFAFAGAVVMIRKSKQGRAFSLIAFLFLYVIASWTCWWYGSSFSSRAAIDMYPLCIVFIGFALQGLFTSLRRKIVTVISVTLLACLNLVQTYQASQDILDLSFMTRAYYTSTFLQLSPVTPEQRNLLAFDRERAYVEGFESNKKNYACVYTLESNFSPPESIGPEHEYATEYFIPVADYIHKSHAWIKITWRYEGAPEQLTGTLFYVAARYKDLSYSWQGYAATDNAVYVDSGAHEISFYYLTPNIRTTRDRLLFGAMKNSGEALHLTSRRIEIFEPVVDYQ